jgi:hypothetical protein
VIGYTSHGAATMANNGMATSRITAQTTPALSMRNLSHLTRASHSIVSRCGSERRADVGLRPNARWMQ